ncbi:asparagine synthase-related protein [Pedomonas sp. V897]|uniref:asparagine synthase-related protein n=1 Tax=Pedomonas sp. V897 TaxID=3446482 RepID=UPI003EE2C44C
MTILAGVFRHDRQPVDEGWRRSLVGALSRDPRDVPQVIDRPGLLMAKVDVGVLGAPAFIDDGNAAIGAGEPLLGGSSAASTRQQDLKTLLRAHVAGEGVEAFLQARGTYAAAFYDLAGHRLCLANDRLGVRTLYYARLGDCVVFATARRILDALPFVPKRVDNAALHEWVTAEYCFENRTPYEGVFMLRGGERLLADADGARLTVDWDWASVPDDRPVTPEAVEELYQLFVEAVDLRLKGDTAARALLSGGLDSRMIVTELRRRGLEVRTLTLTWPRSLDAVLAEQYAAAIGTRHFMADVPRPLEYDISHYTEKFLRAEADYREVPGARPGLVWAGDGGSVCLGFVNTTPPLVEALRAGRYDEAARIHVERKFLRLRAKLLRREERERFAGYFETRIADILRSYGGRDPGRALQWFMMTTQERYQVSGLYENIDLRRIEYVMPLFDAWLAAAFQRFPLDECVGHKLYDRWMDRFPAVVRSVPWQAYAGHIASPLPLPDADIQWKPLSAEYHAQQRRTALARYHAVRKAGTERPPFVRPEMELAAYWFTRLGHSKLAYLLDAAAAYRAWWSGRSDL